MTAAAARLEVSARADAPGGMASRPPIGHRVKVQPGRKRCSSCGRVGHDRRSCGKLEKFRAFEPWSDLEWEEHEEARRIVAENPDGLTLEQVGAILGITRERVRQIEAAALHKITTGTGCDVVEESGHFFALVSCERCDSSFVRRGRSRICDLCAAPPRPSKPRKPRPAPVKKRPEMGAFVLIIGFG